MVRWDLWSAQAESSVFFGGLSGVAGGVAGFLMTGDGSMIAVFWVRSYDM